MVVKNCGLIVLHTQDLDREKAFFEAIGLEFAQEQHGSGPVHFAATLDNLVLELYPGNPTSSLHLGLVVDELEPILERLSALDDAYSSLQIRKLPSFHHVTPRSPTGITVALRQSTLPSFAPE